MEDPRDPRGFFVPGATRVVRGTHRKRRARKIESGEGFRDWIEHDHDLASLHGMPRLHAILARLDRDQRTGAGLG